MKPAQKEELILKNMRALGITRKEAEELIEDDEAVDRGEEMPWDLTPEQLKNARKLVKAPARTITKPVNRTKKDNPDKKEIMQALLAGLAENIETEIDVTNPERTLDFVLNNVKYTVTLTAHRK